MKWAFFLSPVSLGRSTRPAAVMILAVKTLEAVNHSLEADQGANFRRLFSEALKECHDVFNPVYDRIPRTHLGASLIGKPCSRELWYSFHWAKYPHSDGRMVRLFNRGHLEEARFIALLRNAGMTTWHDMADSKDPTEIHQFRIGGHDGHYGGSLDGIGYGCPDLPEGTYFLIEFKTHGKKSFEKLVKEGVEKSKPVHTVQLNQYMGEWKLPYALYCAVCKDTDDLHFEIVKYDQYLHHSYFDRAGEIIFATQPPARIHDSSSWLDCKFCDFRDICWSNSPCEHNCRTCRFSTPSSDASWKCGDTLRCKNAQFEGCAKWDARAGL